MKKNKKIQWLLISIVAVIGITIILILMNKTSSEPSNLDEIMNIVSQVKYNDANLTKSCFSFGCDFLGKSKDTDLEPPIISVYDLTTLGKNCSGDFSSKYQVYTGFSYDRIFYYSTYELGETTATMYYWCGKSNDKIAFTSNNVNLIDSYFKLL